MYRVSFDDRSVTVFRDASLKKRLSTIGVRGYFLMAVLAGAAIGAAAIGYSLSSDSESIASVLFFFPLAALTFWAFWMVVSHVRFGLTKLTVRFAPEGITEEIGGRSIAHPWTWLSRFKDDDARLVLTLGTGGAKHVLILDKRTSGAIAKKLLGLFADHAAPTAAQFSGATPRASKPSKRASEPATNLRDLN